jgi:aminocarboxymuconate-semialdehyde decarboxylase
MADIAFTGCSVVSAAHEQAHPGARRREVVVNGRRVKTVDVHSHCVIPETLLLMKQKFRGKTRQWTTSSTHRA